MGCTGTRHVRDIVLSVLLLLGALQCRPAFAQDFQISLPKQSLAQSLKELARQTGANILFTPDAVQGVGAPEIHGQMSLADAVAKLLSLTSLESIADGNGGLIVRPKSSKSTAEQQGPSSLNSNQDERDRISEIVVTGTHIKGAAPAGSPLTTYTRTDIDLTGLQTTQDFLNTIPQNFAGGVSPTTNANGVPGRNQSLNVGLGSGINLRGLGADATLVLLNGHRITQTVAGNFVDVSSIPLSAIDRIDILSDGASAIYGSDAVAGVVNIVLKDQFEGVEIRTNGGTVTDGGHHTFGAGVTTGHGWETGSVMATYDFRSQNHLDRDDRPFASSLVGDLLPGISQHQVLIDGRQQIGAASVAFDAEYSRRNTWFLSNTLGSGIPIAGPNEERRATNQLYGSGARAEIPLFNSLELSVSANFSESVVDDTQVGNYANSPSSNFINLDNYTSKLFDVGAGLSRPLFALKGGDLSATIGFDYRHEAFTASSTQNGTPNFPIAPERRDVRSEYVEIFAPLISPDNGVPAANRLQLSAAVRHDEYSDAGSTTNPKIGVQWQPIADLTLRSSYGRSFRAPSFDQQDITTNFALLSYFNDPDAGHQTLAILLGGNEPKLKPETSRTYSFGVDYKPSWEQGLTGTVNYFNTQFKNRIALPSNDPFNILSNGNQFSSIVTRNPSAAQIASAVAIGTNGYGFIDATGGSNPSGAQAIVNNLSQNIGSTKVDGLDVHIAQAFTWLAVNWNAAVDLARLFHFTKQLTPESPSAETLATLYNPPKARLRGSLAWNKQRWSGAAFLNFTPSYVNDFGQTATSIEHWTTFDGSISYTVRDDVAVSFVVQDIFDTPPPRVTLSATASAVALESLGYDPANASPLGRFVSISLRKKF